MVSVLHGGIRHARYVTEREEYRWWGDIMRLVYGDPPYLGQAKRHYSHDPSGIPAEEVDYPALIEKLKTYDGWALSCSSPSLFQLLCIVHFGKELHVGDSVPEDLCPQCRTAAWVKPFCSWKPTHRVQYAWEPVIFVPVRPRGDKKVPSVRDFVSANMTMRKGTHGAKPVAFCDWILNLLGWQPGDTVDDLFPGSGAFTDAIKWKELTGDEKDEENEI